MTANEKHWPTHSSQIRSWINNHEELRSLRDRITNECKKFPCCGDLKQEYKVSFYHILEKSETLKAKLKSEGITYVSIVSRDQCLTQNL